MKLLATKTYQQIPVVIGGFAGWILATALIPISHPWNVVASLYYAAFSFFLVACFLPEYQRKRILTRQVSLRVSSFFIWIGTSCILYALHKSEIADGLPNMTLIILSGAIVLAFASYFPALWMIRGIRTKPFYADDLLTSSTLEHKSETTTIPSEADPVSTETKSSPPDHLAGKTH
ncbi:hypothetical protein JIN85_07245 [Luteolibacter pohnpeiensis]|uniref:Uncharacterized protein n=1 Tax=Luteolibacter pohnpeiensis TaxID=454153 RepID=A0A934VVW7_9BACT|nr:hypothetical protein [Luteolibacter pohnpeiensis]MBK1882203.1 hypothetical protein [Luteolibacter pohnpeiensis]